MTLRAAQNAGLAMLNELAPSWGMCFSVSGAHPCPTSPTVVEVLWWHTVTVILLLTAAISLWVEHRGWPENQAHGARRDA